MFFTKIFPISSIGLGSGTPDSSWTGVKKAMNKAQRPRKYVNIIKSYKTKKDRGTEKAHDKGFCRIK